MNRICTLLNIAPPFSSPIPGRIDYMRFKVSRVCVCVSISWIHTHTHAYAYFIWQFWYVSWSNCVEIEFNLSHTYNIPGRKSYEKENFGDIIFPFYIIKYCSRAGGIVYLSWNSYHVIASWEKFNTNCVKRAGTEWCEWCCGVIRTDFLSSGRTGGRTFKRLHALGVSSCRIICPKFFNVSGFTFHGKCDKVPFGAIQSLSRKRNHLLLLPVRHLHLIKIPFDIRKCATTWIATLIWTYK